jgi:hypothetical protein
MVGLRQQGRSRADVMAALAAQVGYAWRKHRRLLPRSVQEPMLDLLVEIKQHVLPSSSKDLPSNIRDARSDVKDMLSLFCKVASRPATAEASSGDAEPLRPRSAIREVYPVEKSDLYGPRRKATGVKCTWCGTWQPLIGKDISHTTDVNWCGVWQPPQHHDSPARYAAGRAMPAEDASHELLSSVITMAESQDFSSSSDAIDEIFPETIAPTDWHYAVLIYEQNAELGILSSAVFVEMHPVIIPPPVWQYAELIDVSSSSSSSSSQSLS